MDFQTIQLVFIVNMICVVGFSIYLYRYLNDEEKENKKKG